MFALGVWVVTESNLLVREEVMVARHVFKNLRLAPVTNIVLPPLFSALAWGWVPSLWLILWCFTQFIFSAVLVLCYHKWSISSDREIVPDKWISISVRLNFFGGGGLGSVISRAFVLAFGISLSVDFNCNGLLYGGAYRICGYLSKFRSFYDSARFAASYI